MVSRLLRGIAGRAVTIVGAIKEKAFTHRQPTVDQFNQETALGSSYLSRQRSYYVPWDGVVGIGGPLVTIHVILTKIISSS